MSILLATAHQSRRLCLPRRSHRGDRRDAVSQIIPRGRRTAVAYGGYGLGVAFAGLGVAVMGNPILRYIEYIIVYACNIRKYTSIYIKGFFCVYKILVEYLSQPKTLNTLLFLLYFCILPDLPRGSVVL